MSEPVPDTVVRRLAVLGSPISHSRSPQLHAAAYAVLGLPWEYSAIEVVEGSLGAFLDTCGPEWLGFSLTMPLKREVLPMLRVRSEPVTAVAAANTVVLDGMRGFNTDVAGIVAAFQDHGIESLSSVEILGGGATAASALAAAVELGATSAILRVRDPERAAAVLPPGAARGMELAIRPLEERAGGSASAIISTLPPGAADEVTFAETVRRSAVLLDVAYEPWPSALATAWTSVGGTVVSGLEMLLHQAVEQVRIFVTGHQHGPLPHEKDVIAAMRAAVGL